MIANAFTSIREYLKVYGPLTFTADGNRFELELDQEGKLFLNKSGDNPLRELPESDPRMAELVYLYGGQIQRLIALAQEQHEARIRHLTVLGRKDGGYQPDPSQP